ncbi:MAG: hypothetical protein ABW148_10435 [Sedimenticola sp.]
MAETLRHWLNAGLRSEWTGREIKHRYDEHHSHLRSLAEARKKEAGFLIPIVDFRG